jgi:FMN-dependent NADH-azoreductase
MMKSILLVNASLNGDKGNSHSLSSQFVEQLASTQQVSITDRDLNQTPLAHLSESEMAAWMTPEAERTDNQVALEKVSSELIKEVTESDILVIGMPMYNFGVPSTFKAWIDRIARAGITFKYTETGPVGLLKDKKVIIVAARGGLYEGTDKDTQSKYLTDVLGFLGLTDVTFVYAEGLAMSDNQEQSLAKAKQQLTELANQL